MLATRSDTDARPAERILEDLLKAWPSSDHVDAAPAPNRHAFGLAFLPAASHQAPRLPTFRPTRLDDGAGLRSTQGSLRLATDERRGAMASLGTIRSFEAVANAVALHSAGHRAPGAGEVEPESDDAHVDEFHPLDEYRFVARVVALEAAGVLDSPAARAGGSPAPAGHADGYSADEDDDGSADHMTALSAIAEPDARLGRSRRLARLHRRERLRLGGRGVLFDSAAVDLPLRSRV